jgi:hypothetical protein
VIVREATGADQAALRALAAASPYGGAVTFRREQHVPAEQIPSGHEISEYFVAEIDGVIAGTALPNVGTCRFEGEDARWEWRDTATSLLLTHDPRSAVHQLVAGRSWLPTTSATLAVRSSRPMLEETLVEQL